MVKRFKDYLNDVEREREAERFAFYYFDSDDILAKFVVLNMLTEEAKHLKLGKGREVIFHRAHVPNTQDHLHFLQKGAKLYALNRDGSAHDRSHGEQMDAWAMGAVRDNYRGFTLPPTGLIEALMASPMQGGILLEGVTEVPSLPIEILNEALDKASKM